MKTILSILAILLFAATGSAQSPLAKTSTSAVQADTSANAEQIYLYTKILAPRNLTSVKFTGTKLSGYVKGSVALQILDDTTGFAAGTATWITLADSLTLVNQTTNKKIWDAVGFGRYHRIRITTIDSTQSLRVIGRYTSK